MTRTTKFYRKMKEKLWKDSVLNQLKIVVQVGCRERGWTE